MIKNLFLFLNPSDDPRVVPIDPPFPYIGNNTPLELSLDSFLLFTLLRRRGSSLLLFVIDLSEEISRKRTGSDKGVLAEVSLT